MASSGKGALETSAQLVDPLVKDRRASISSNKRTVFSSVAPVASAKYSIFAICDLIGSEFFATGLDEDRRFDQDGDAANNPKTML